MLKSFEIADASRNSALKMVHASKSSHIGSSLSVIDILSVIVAGADLKIRRELGNELIISKGHAAAGVYSVLAHSGLSLIHISEPTRPY